MSLQEDFQYAADEINNADALIIAAGAGIGVDSGLPDFRGSSGYWKAYPALGKQEFISTKLPTQRLFAPIHD